MDFILIKDEKIHIIDWKTGKKDENKHRKQLLAYALAAKGLNPVLKSEDLFPKAVYLNEIYDELSLEADDKRLADFAKTIELETEEMQKYCSDIAENIPLSIENFSKTSNENICRICEFKELCLR
jgi:CRISPR/Cas system-associated exonuclease Cas4 (RecB family)